MCTRTSTIGEWYRLRDTGTHDTKAALTADGSDRSLVNAATPIRYAAADDLMRALNEHIAMAAV